MMQCNSLVSVKEYKALMLSMTKNRISIWLLYLIFEYLG